MNFSPGSAWKTVVAIVALIAAAIPANIHAAPYTPPASNHVDYNFNYDWFFLKSNPTGGASAVTYSESAFTPVSLPHTWSDDRFREWVFDSNDKPADPLRPGGSYTGTAWYRKHFTLPASYSGREIILEFQGVTYIPTFYVNGQLVGYCDSGFGPTGIDITPYVTFGSDNVIAVSVSNDQNAPLADYENYSLPAGTPFNVNMGGINRDVTLHITDKAHLTKPLYRNLGAYGTYIYPTSIDTLHQTCTLNIQAEVRNDYTVAQTITCNSVVVDASGNVVATLSGGSETLAAGTTGTYTETTAMSGVHFWDPSYPYLYQVYTQLTLNGQVVDVDQITTGIRTYVFNPSFGLEINGHPIYLNGFAPRISMEWPAVGTPVDWMNDYDFQMMKAGGANLCRSMQCAPHLEQVQAADRYGIVMVVPAAYTEDDLDSSGPPNPEAYQEDLDIMRDNTIYFRNNPSVLFYEACNGDPSAAHMTGMLNIRKQYDPSGGRLAGARTHTTATNGIREYSGSMDANDGADTSYPSFDCEYARTEGPRRIWDEYTPEYNPSWNGTNSSVTPVNGVGSANPNAKYLLGGYFNVSSLYHQAFGFFGANEQVPPTNGDAYGSGDFIGEFLTPIASGTSYTGAYYRCNSQEDMVLENLAKQYGRYELSNFVQSPQTSSTKGVMVGGAKIIWSDSWTDGRMHDMEVARTSGAVDGVRLPKETFYGLQVAFNPYPQTYIVGHWNYPAGTVKTVYVCSNTANVDLKTYDTSGNLIKDYGLGTKSFFPSSILPTGGDMVNNWVFAFPNVAWQAGSIIATGLNSSGAIVATSTKSTAGAPDHLRLTPTVGPSGWMADGSDVAWFDVEVVDANGNRCPTYQDFVTFNCSGNGTFLGGYNSGIRYSTNLAHLTSGYSLQIENGINRVFVRSTRTAGPFTLNVTGTNNTTGQAFTANASASSTINSIAVDDTAGGTGNGIATAFPQKTGANLAALTEPTPVAEGTPPPVVNQLPVAPATNVVNYQYTGGNTGSTVIENVQSGQVAYVDEPWTLPALPSYLVGTEYIQPYQTDAQDTSATDQYGFDLTDYSYVYAVIDAANGMPNNDNNASYSWQLMPNTIVLNGRTMNIYRSRVMQPYESVLLADNGYGTSPFSANSNMYLVFVQNLETQVVKPADTAVASSAQGGNPASAAIDGNTSTRWAASSATYTPPQTVEITLDQPYAIGGYDINWYDNSSRYYQYKIQVSNDGINWQTSLDNSGNTTEGDYQYRVPPSSSMVGKYVLISATKCSDAAGYASIYEVKINGVPASTVTPLFTSPNVATGSAGSAFQFQVLTSEGTSTYTAAGLPTGLTIDPNSGIISGTSAQSGTFTVTVSATNSAGTSTQTLTLTLAGGAAMTDTPTLPQWALILLGILLAWTAIAPKRRAPAELS
jgi:hypothetical protein